MTCEDLSYIDAPTYKLQQTLARIKNKIIEREGHYTNKFEWISVNDSLPEKEKVIVVGQFCESESTAFKECLITNGKEVIIDRLGHYGGLVGFGEGYECINFDTYSDAPFATHWMPLPSSEVLAT